MAKRSDRVWTVARMIARGMTDEAIMAAFSRQSVGLVRGYIDEAKRVHHVVPPALKDAARIRKVTMRTRYGSQDAREGSATVSLPREPWEAQP